MFLVLRAIGFKQPATTHASITVGNSVWNLTGELRSLVLEHTQGIPRQTVEMAVRLRKKVTNILQTTVSPYEALSTDES